ncbi:hypothetical protein ACNKHU_24135 [Shigella flexneri]
MNRHLKLFDLQSRRMNLPIEAEASGLISKIVKPRFYRQLPIAASILLLRQSLAIKRRNLVSGNNASDCRCGGKRFRGGLINIRPTPSKLAPVLQGQSVAHLKVCSLCRIPYPEQLSIAIAVAGGRYGFGN